MIKNSRTWCTLCALIKCVENSKLSLKGHTNRRVALQAGCRQWRRSLSQHRCVAGAGCCSGYVVLASAALALVFGWLCVGGVWAWQKLLGLTLLCCSRRCRGSDRCLGGAWCRTTGGKGCRPVQIPGWPSPFSMCYPCPGGRGAADGSPAPGPADIPAWLQPECWWVSWLSGSWLPKRRKYSFRLVHRLLAGKDCVE